MERLFGASAKRDGEEVSISYAEIGIVGKVKRPYMNAEPEWEVDAPYFRSSVTSSRFFRESELNREYVIEANGNSELKFFYTDSEEKVKAWCFEQQKKMAREIAEEIERLQRALANVVNVQVLKKPEKYWEMTEAEAKAATVAVHLDDTHQDDTHQDDAHQDDAHQDDVHRALENVEDEYEKE